MTGDGTVTKLVVDNKSDAAIAAELRAELETALRPVMEILNRARTHGMEMNFAMQRDQTGRWFLPPIAVSKPL